VDKEPFYKTLNNYRIVPRILVAGYSYLMYEVSNWFMLLVDPTGTQATFVSVLVGASAAVFGLYTMSGTNNAK